METKEFIDAFNKDWTEFKQVNDERLKAAASGKSVAELEQKMAKINEALDAHQQKTAQLEAALRRPQFETKGIDGHVLTAEQIAHKAAFTQFFRKGDVGNLEELQKKALAVNDDTSGGYMVHADLSGRIIKRIFETSPIRLYANVQTISTDALEGTVDADQAAAQWVAERGARAQTGTPKIGVWRIPTHELFAEPAATQKLLDDAAWNAEQWLSEKVADKFARTENAAFVSGTGAGQPTGFVSKTIVAESGVTDDSYISGKKIGYIPTGAANDFLPPPASGTDPAPGDCLLQAIFALKTQYREMPGTAWAFHRTVFGKIRRLRDNYGRYLWEPSLAAGQPSTLLGYACAEFNDMPQLGATNKFAIAFANWREFYQIVDRVGIRVLRDPYTAKPHVLFYTTKRVGGDVLNFEAAKFIKFATT